MVSNSLQHCATQRKLSARARGISSMLGKPACQRRRFRPSPSPGCSWSGVSTWSDLSRRPPVVSLTCLSRWTSSPSGSRRNPSPKPTPRRPILTLSTGSVYPTPSSQTMGQPSQARSSWSSLANMGSGSTGHRSDKRAPTGLHQCYNRPCFGGFGRVPARRSIR
jgi:hypothetical protein